MSVCVKQNGQLVKTAGLYSVTAPIGMADIYSTEEKEVGVWTDGKPLYQKTINFQSIDITTSSSGMYYYAFTTANYISNAELILGKTEMSYVITNGGTRVFEDIEQQGTLTVLWSKISRPSVDAVVTIKYTKTTDVAGSGKYVPSGDKAVHYSADEHIIGTWTDGSTLYERTVRVPANTTGQNIVTLWNDTNIQVRDYSGCFVFRASENTATLSCRPTDASYKLVVYTIGCSEQYGVYAEVDLGTQRGNAVDLMLTLKYIKVTS